MLGSLEQIDDEEEEEEFELEDDDCDLEIESNPELNSQSFDKEGLCRLPKWMRHSAMKKSLMMMMMMMMKRVEELMR